jgi:hypothetical protein
LIEFQNLTPLPYDLIIAPMGNPEYSFPAAHSHFLFWPGDWRDHKIARRKPAHPLCIEGIAPGMGNGRNVSESDIAGKLNLYGKKVGVISAHQNWVIGAILGEWK